MNTLFREFEHENEMRTYPFASGCVPVDTDGIPISTGLLVDAAFYPVNPSGTLYLSGILSDGTVTVSDSTGVIMSARKEPGSSVLEFYETAGLGRHVGTLAAATEETLDILIGRSADRTFRRSATEFASSCVFPVVNDGVLSLSTGGTPASDGLYRYTNSEDEEIRVSTDAAGSTLRFDVLPRPDDTVPESIRQIYCIVDGKTPFRIEKINGNVIVVYLDNITKDDVCANAHRENALVMADTCDCKPPTPPEPVEIPEFYQAEVVDMFTPGVDSAFYLDVPNLTGYTNPLSVTLSDGITLPKLSSDVETDPSGRKSTDVTDSQTSKGAILQVPGLAATA